MQMIFDGIMSGFVWIINSFNWLVVSTIEFISNLVIIIINFLIEVITMLIGLIMSVLPDSPFKTLELFNFPGLELLGYLDFVIPFDFILKVMGAWILCMGIYYIYKIIMKLIKVV